MQAQSVLGTVPAADLGLTLMHEHLLFDFSVCLSAPRSARERHMAKADVISLETRGALRFNPCVVADNLVQRDVALAVEEVRVFVDLGGQTLVDPTNASIGRDPQALQQIARETGLTIVMGAGYYYQVALDEAFARRSVDDVADEIISDVRHGVGDTGVRAGLIGEIGTSAPMTPAEEKSLRAAARAQAETGAPLMVHVDGWGREGHRVLDVIEEEGAAPTRTVLCHMNPSWADSDYQISLAERGAYLAFDMLGIDHFYPPDRASPDELSVIGAISDLIGRGYVRQLLLSQDVYLKMMLKRYGGYGYTHIFANLGPYFAATGVSEEYLDVMMRDNSRRVLAFLP